MDLWNIIKSKCKNFKKKLEYVKPDPYKLDLIVYNGSFCKDNNLIVLLTS